MREVNAAEDQPDAGAPAAPACTGDLDCPCEECDADRARRISRGSRLRHVDQPWNPKRKT